MKAPVGWGTGVRESRIIDDVAKKYFTGGTMKLLYNHHDQVIKIPENAVCFATSNFCPYEGFYISNHIVTFQGHPEYTAEYNKHLIINHAQNESETVKNNALTSLSQQTESKEAASWILGLG